ncbi:MAG: 3-Phosphoglycerate kinase [Bacteroidota bacterium]|jgi:phosphoglycerate kinase
MIQSIQNLEVQSKICLVRVDYNVPQNEDLEITDDKRIRESIPTIVSLISRGAKVVLMSHLGRPKGTFNSRYTLAPIARRLGELLHKEILFSSDCIGDTPINIINQMSNGDIVLLENLRFYKEEEENSQDFSSKLADLGDIYINDAFGTAHRAHASTEGIAKYFTQKAAGLLIEKELAYLDKAIHSPKRPLIAVLGGAKVSGKIDVINNLLPICDHILIGGGMMFTFLKAMGHHIGSSMVENDRIDTALQLLHHSEFAEKLHIPTDTIVASKFSNDADTMIVDCEDIPENWMGLDIGPKTIERFSALLKQAGTVVWNGPMGVFEMPKFEHGTQSIAQTLASITSLGAITIIGGGDSAAAISKFGLEHSVSHVSTGGGASLEFLEGKILPGILALEM